MECTNEKEYVEEQKIRTRRIWKSLSKHKFITTILAMFISFSVLNVLLILNFLNLLEKINYMH